MGLLDCRSGNASSAPGPRSERLTHLSSVIQTRSAACGRALIVSWSPGRCRPERTCFNRCKSSRKGQPSPPACQTPTPQGFDPRECRYAHRSGIRHIRPFSVYSRFHHLTPRAAPTSKIAQCNGNATTHAVRQRRAALVEGPAAPCANTEEHRLVIVR